MERIFENIVRSMESKEEVSSHPPDGFDERGRARRGEAKRRVKTGPEAGPAKTHVPTMRVKCIVLHSDAPCFP